MGWELAQYFGLPAVDAEALCGMLPEARSAVPRDCQRIHPYFKVLPMGFSWSFFLAQEALRTCVSRALPSARFLVDHEPAPSLDSPEPIVLVYADNGFHLGLDAGKVEREREQVSRYSNSVGLSTHEEGAATTLAQGLGVVVDGAKLLQA